jgi:hypothetical protein
MIMIRVGVLLRWFGTGTTRLTVDRDEREKKEKMEKSLPPSFPFCRLLSPVVALCPLFPRQQGRRSSRASIIPTRYTLRELNLTTYATRKIDPLLSRCASL